MRLVRNGTNFGMWTYVDGLLRVVCVVSVDTPVFGGSINPFYKIVYNLVR